MAKFIRFSEMRPEVLQQFSWRTGKRGGEYWLPEGKPDIPKNRRYGKAAEAAAKAAGQQKSEEKPAESPTPEPKQVTTEEIEAYINNLDVYEEGHFAAALWDGERRLDPIWDAPEGPEKAAEPFLAELDAEISSGDVRKAALAWRVKRWYKHALGNYYHRTRFTGTDGFGYQWKDGRVIATPQQKNEIPPPPVASQPAAEPAVPQEPVFITGQELDDLKANLKHQGQSIIDDLRELGDENQKAIASSLRASLRNIGGMNDWDTVGEIFSVYDTMRRTGIPLFTPGSERIAELLYEIPGFEFIGYEQGFNPKYHDSPDEFIETGDDFVLVSPGAMLKTRGAVIRARVRKRLPTDPPKGSNFLEGMIPGSQIGEFIRQFGVAGTLNRHPSGTGWQLGEYTGMTPAEVVTKWDAAGRPPIEKPKSVGNAAKSVGDAAKSVGNAAKSVGDATKPWTISADEYARRQGAPKPTPGLLDESSAHQRSRMSTREINDMLKQKSQQRREKRAKYEAAVAEWNGQTLDAVVKKEANLADLFDTDVSYLMVRIGSDLGFDVPSPFRLSLMEDTKRRAILKDLQDFIAANADKARAALAPPTAQTQVQNAPKQSPPKVANQQGPGAAATKAAPPKAGKTPAPTVPTQSVTPPPPTQGSGPNLNLVRPLSGQAKSTYDTMKAHRARIQELVNVGASPEDYADIYLEKLFDNTGVKPKTIAEIWAGISGAETTPAMAREMLVQWLGTGYEIPKKKRRFSESEGQAEKRVAIAGPDGEQVEILLANAIRKGRRLLLHLAKRGAFRLLQSPNYQAVRSIFTDQEFEAFSDAAAATVATANLLARARVREMMEDSVGPNLFSERPAFRMFADAPPTVLLPEQAVNYFEGLVPGMAENMQAFTPAMRRQGFTIAASTDRTLTENIKKIIAEALRTGETVETAAGMIDDILEAAGVSPANPQYADMVFRTNMMDAYNVGQEAELQQPGMEEFFPGWEYVGIADGRQGEDHEPHFGRFFSRAIGFDSVRGPRRFNCRCSMRPVFRDEWERVAEAGQAIGDLGDYLRTLSMGQPAQG